MAQTDLAIAGVGGQGSILAGVILGSAAVTFDSKYATQTQADIEPQRPGGNCRDFDRLLIAQAHDRTFAESPLNLAQRGIQRLGFVFHIFHYYSLLYSFIANNTFFN